MVGSWFRTSHAASLCPHELHGHLQASSLAGAGEKFELSCMPPRRLFRRIPVAGVSFHLCLLEVELPLEWNDFTEPGGDGGGGKIFIVDHEGVQRA